MGLAGSGMGVTNVQLRFFTIIFIGIIAFAVVLIWRQHTLSSISATASETKTQLADPDSLHSKNYKVQVEDTSPTAQ